MSYGYWNRKMEPSESMQPSEWIEKLEQYAKTQGATSEHFSLLPQFEATGCSDRLTLIRSIPKVCDRIPSASLD